MSRKPAPRKVFRVMVCGFELALVVTATSSPNETRAFCRTSTCTDCPRDPPTGCTIGGTPDACVSFSMHQAASDAIELGAATALTAEAFAFWESARWGSDETPASIQVSSTFGPAVCGRPQYNPSSGNTTKGNELGSTSVTFARDGSIYDADVEINATGPVTLLMSENVQAEFVSVLSAWALRRARRRTDR